MTNTDDAMLERRQKRNILRYGLLTLVVVALGLGWTYAWTRARDVVATNFEALLTREAAAGRVHDCLNRKVSGYPFHIEISCDNPVMRLTSAAGEVTVSAQKLQTVALVYNPQHIITDLTAPVILRQNDQVVAQFGFGTGRFSLRHDFKGVQRFSFVGSDLVAAANADSPAMSVKAFELHILAVSGAHNALSQNYDMAIKADAALLAGAAPDQASDLALNAKLENWPLAFKDMRNSVEQWRAQDGKLSLSDVRLSRNGGTLSVNGEARLNETFHADGRFEATFVNSPALLRGLIMNGNSDAGAMFGPLLQLLGKPVTFEGQRGSQIQLTMTNGVISLGSLVLAEVPPLY